MTTLDGFLDEVIISSMTWICDFESFEILNIIIIYFEVP